MRCKNCGANYRTRELKCPYCNTENLLGKIWQTERSQAELEYESEKKRVGKILVSPYMFNRLLNRTILVLALLYAVSIGFVFLAFLFSEQFEKLHYSLHEDEIVARMEEYYNAGEYERLYQYMDEEYVDLQAYYTYTQATLLNYAYNRYMEYRLCFQELTDEEKMEDEYYLEYALRYSKDVYTIDCGIYSKPDEKNQELYELYQKEIMAYWVGTLKLTEEEIAYLSDEESYSYGELEEIVQAIKERRCF